MTRLIKNSRGVTLMELMVAMAILTIGVIGAMGSFRYITMAISSSRLQTIATNLAQEKMEVLKNKSYYQLLVTTSANTSTGFNPNYVYDVGRYPPEVITLWGLPAITRSVNVDYASPNGVNVTTVPYNSYDTGMKKISVYVSWTDRGASRVVRIENYAENPTAATLSTAFKGVVRDRGASPVASALVQVIGSPKWRGYSDAGGNYSFQVAAGSYSLVASSVGYFSQSSSELSVTDGLSVTYNPTLTKISTGSIGADQIYTINPSLVISQVVASTIVPSNVSAGFDLQYIELFNGTTASINIGAGASHSIKLNFTSRYPGPDQVCNDIGLIYVSTFVAPGGYYLIASTKAFALNSVPMTADAYYTDTANNPACSNTGVAGFTWAPAASPPTKPILFYGHSGTVWLTDAAGKTLDAVGWNDGGSVPTNCETGCVPLSAGLLRSDQLVRFSTPCAPGTAYGRAYDTDDNRNNFYYNNTGSGIGITYQPFNSASALQTILSGRPSTSGVVFANDGNSASGFTTSGLVSGAQGQSCVYSSFTLVNVATGTWSLTAMAGNFAKTIVNVSVAAGAATKIQNAATLPVWPLGGYNHTALSSASIGGFATGFVNGAGTNSSIRLPGILVAADNGKTTRTDSSGFYMLNVSTGTHLIKANFNSDNASYMTSNAAAAVIQGAMTTLPDFHLAQGAFIRGYVTSGLGALPNISVSAKRGGTVFQDTSDNTGYFYIFVSTSTSPYTIAPDLDPMQSYTTLPTTPLTATVPDSCCTIYTGTITVTGSLGTITGKVTSIGSPITTGVLVVASTDAISNTPPPIYASTAPSVSVSYTNSSQSDGTYSVDVRASATAYNVRAFFPVVDPNTGATSYTSKLRSGINVTAGATVSGQDFAWP